MKWYRLLEVALVLVVLGSAYFRGLDVVPFHGDESHWIATSCYLEAFLTRDFAEPEWLRRSVLANDFSAPDWVTTALSPTLSSPHVWSMHYWTMTQPPVSRYMIGLGRLAGGYHVSDLNHPWDFQVDDAHNIVSGAKPSPGLLWSSRAMMALLSVISGALLFLLVRHAAGAVAGCVFVGLFVGSDYLLIHLRRAMSEPPLLFFTTLTLLAGARAVMIAPRRGVSLSRRPASLIWLLMMGAGTGLAGAAKLNGLALYIAGAALCFSIIYRGQDSNRLRLALALSFFLGLVAALVFTAVNPFLYPQPPFRTIAMGLFRRWEMINQASRPWWRIDGLNARLRIVPRRILQDYAVIHIGILNGLLLAVGLYHLARTARLWLVNKGGSPASVAILAVAAVTALPPLLTPLDWDRYYMYPVIFTSLCVAIGIGQIAQMGWRRLSTVR